MTKRKKLGFFFKKLSKITMIAIVAVFITITANAQNSSGEVVTLLGYLYVFPEDLGDLLRKEVSGIITAINKNNAYGYNTWRLPTLAEIKIMSNYKSKIGIEEIRYDSEKCFNYMTYEYFISEPDATYGSRNVRLVSTGTVDEDETVQKEIADDMKKKKEQEEKQLKENAKKEEQMFLTKWHTGSTDGAYRVVSGPSDMPREHYYELIFYSNGTFTAEKTFWSGGNPDSGTGTRFEIKYNGTYVREGATIRLSWTKNIYSVRYTGTDRWGYNNGIESNYSTSDSETCTYYINTYNNSLVLGGSEFGNTYYSIYKW